MLKPIRWNTFIKDFVIIQIGFLLYGLAIALIVRANLGQEHGWYWKLRSQTSLVSKSGR